MGRVFKEEKSICMAQFQELSVHDDIESIYFLFQENVLQYVGRSKTVLNRISRHKAGKPFSKVRFIQVPKDYAGKYEGAFIKFFHPPLNKTGNGEISDDERSLIAEYVDESFFLYSKLVDADYPTEFGLVAAMITPNGVQDIFDEPYSDSKLVFGIYDDDAGREDDDHDDGCEMMGSLEALKKICGKDIPEDLKEKAWEKCKCIDRAVVYLDGFFDGTVTLDVKQLRSIDPLKKFKEFKKIVSTSEVSIFSKMFDVHPEYFLKSIQENGGQDEEKTKSNA